MQSRNNFKDAAKKTMKCMSKQGTPILDISIQEVQRFASGKKKKKTKSILFISQGQNSKSAATDLFFSNYTIYECDRIFIPVNEVY